MSLAPIVLFVYNRPWHTEQTLNALMQNELASESVLYIYADGPKENSSKEELQKIEDTRQIIRKQTYCKETFIVESAANKGLANSVIDGVTTIVNKYGKIIVLEDDLITSTGFLKFMNDALNRYLSEEKIWQVSGFFFPIKNIKHTNSSFFLPYASSWGWATWKRAWNNFDPLAANYQKLKIDKDLALRFDLNGSYSYTAMLINQMENKNIDSWAIRWWWSIFINEALALFPDKSLINNIGYGLEATHTKIKKEYKFLKFQNKYYIKNFPQKTAVDRTKFRSLQHFLTNENTEKNRFSIIKKMTLKAKFFELLKKKLKA